MRSNPSTDFEPEYIAAAPDGKSADGTATLFVANEVSGTVSLYNLK